MQTRSEGWIMVRDWQTCQQYITAPPMLALTMKHWPSRAGGASIMPGQDTNKNQRRGNVNLEHQSEIEALRPLVYWPPRSPALTVL